MSNEEMRIAIATVCGWTEIHKRHSSGKWVGKHSSKTERGFPILCELPNYPGSLDAMHEALSLLDGLIIDHQSLYYDLLSLEVGWKSKDMLEARWEATWGCIRATAQQQANAFIKWLKATGRWQEKEKGV